MESCQGILVLSWRVSMVPTLFCAEADRYVNASSVFQYLVAAGKAPHAAWSFQQQLLVV